MAESHYVGAYWGPRREPVTGCAERLASCLTELAEIAPVLDAWRKRGRSRRQSTQDAISPDVPALSELLLAGRNRADFGGEPMEELGFRVSGWNAQDNAASFSVKCGSYSEVPGLGNNFLLKLPAPEGNAFKLYEAVTAEEIARVIINSWAPVWLTWASNAMRSWQPQEPDRPVVGWLTYLEHANPDQVTKNRLPDGVHAREVGTGILIKIGDNPLDVRDDQVRATAAAIEPITKR